MADATVVKTARKGHVATVTIARPEVHNAFNEHVISQLRDAFTALSQDERVRVVVLAGQGRSFSAGADLDWMRRAAKMSEEENRQDARGPAAMFRAVAECPHPVVAKVQGAALGGGAGLAAAADIAIAADTAQFGFSEVRLGLVPATISPHVIEKIGRGRALPLFLTGERISAATALEIGLVYRVVPAAELDSAVDGVVQSLLAGGPRAHGVIKGMVRRLARLDRSLVDGYTAGLIAAVRSGDEAKEGVQAFLEKRKPGWGADD